MATAAELAKLAREIIGNTMQFGLALPRPWLVLSAVQGLHSDHDTEVEARAAFERFTSPQGGEAAQYDASIHGVGVVFWPGAVVE